MKVNELTSAFKTKPIKAWSITAAAFLFLMFLIYCYMSLSAGDPTLIQYRVTSSNGNIETRQYPELFVAQVALEGTRKQTFEEGTQILRSYFQANNQLNKSLKIHAPIMQEAHPRKENLWLVSMLIPLEYYEATLPVANDERIKFLKVPAQDYAVIEFSGKPKGDNLQNHLEALESKLREQQLIPKSKPKYVYYDPEWIFPYFIHNEVWTFVPPDFTLTE